MIRLKEALLIAGKFAEGNLGLYSYFNKWNPVVLARSALGGRTILQYRVYVEETSYIPIGDSFGDVMKRYNSAISPLALRPKSECRT